MSYLSTHFDKEVPVCSSVVRDFSRVVNYDDKGAEILTFEEVDYPKIQVSIGKFEDWKLDSLLSAGVNPAFPIKTGLNTRLEGIGIVNEFEKVAEDILADNFK